jgi:hypothetical protein
MTSRYVLAPQAAQDLVEIWGYVRDQSSLAVADRVETAIRDRIAFLSGSPVPGIGERFNQRERKVFLCLFLLDCLSARDKTVAGCSHPAWPKTCGKDSQSQALKNKGRQLFADGFTLRAKG